MILLAKVQGTFPKPADELGDIRRRNASTSKQLMNDQTKSRQDIDFDNIYSDESSEDDIGENNIEIFSRMTRSGSTYDRIVKRVEEIMKKPTPDESQLELCIIECGRKRNTALLPCRHQPICDKCWFIWSTKCMQQMSVLGEEDILPKCPLCRKPVEENITLFV